MIASSFVTAIEKVIKTVLPNTSKKIPLHEPTFSSDEMKWVTQCIEEGWVSYAGQFVRDFDDALRTQCQVADAVCMVSGTAALHIALIVAGVQPNDEVILPTLTFVASANAIRYCQAIPHFVDSCYENLGIHPEKLREYLKKVARVSKGVCINQQTGRRIVAMMPVHIFGHPCALDELIDIAHEYHLLLIEDAAESLGSFYKNKPTGSFGFVSATSFNGNKIITTGGGGALLTNDVALAARARHLSTTAKKPHPWEFYHDELAYNYRLPNINAALGLAQLKKLDQFLMCKRELAKRYQSAFQVIEEVSFFEEPRDVRSNYWLNAILLSEKTKALKQDLLAHLNQQGILARGLWTPMHLLPAFSDSPCADVSIAMDLYDRVINLPSSPHWVMT